MVVQIVVVWKGRLLVELLDNLRYVLAWRKPLSRHEEARNTFDDRIARTRRGIHGLGAGYHQGLPSHWIGPWAVRVRSNRFAIAGGLRPEFHAHRLFGFVQYEV